MKFTISGVLLKASLECARRVIEVNNSIPVLSNVLIEAKGGVVAFIGTNLDQSMIVPVTVIDPTTLTHTVKSEGSACVDAKHLSELTKTLKKNIVFEIDGDKLLLTSGTINVSMPTVPLEQFPIIEKVAVKKPHLTLTGDALRQMVKDTAFAVTSEKSRFTLQGGKFESGQDGTRLVTTDGYRLAYTSLPKKGKLDAIVPQKALTEAARMANGTVEVRSSDLYLQFDSGGKTLITRKLTGNFPKYEMVMPKDEHTKLVSFDIETFKDAVKRASTTTDKRNNSLTVTFKANEAVIETSYHECVRTEIVPIEYASDELKLGFNVKYLGEFLNNVGSGKGLLSMKDANTRVQFTVEGYDYDYKYILMPLCV